ncbi:MAG: pyridoxal-dependent decarboxylase, partial [Candidatus Latescibacterota bacterium]
AISEDRAFLDAMDRIANWVVHYFNHPESYPVLAQVQPGDVRNRFPADCPETGRTFDDLIDDFEQKILPGITHWNHPAFFAYFAISGSYPGIIAESLTAALNVNGMLWRTSPSLTEIEQLSLQYLRQMLGLPEIPFAMILDTASTSSLLAIAAAREALAELQVREKGLAGRHDIPRLVVYCSEEAHSSIEKAAIVLGIGRENVCRIKTDSDFRMRADELLHRIEHDLACGSKPLCVVATVGTTSTTSVDPVGAIAEICRMHGIWLHVDAAYAGIAAILPEKRNTLAGCDAADSLVVNPHKWLFTPIDLSAFYCRRPSVLKDALSLVPEYLRVSDACEVTNLMDYGFQLGRRFRGLKLWMVINYYGSSGLRNLIRGHLDLANQFAKWVQDSDSFELMAPVPFSTVCFRFHPKIELPSAAAGSFESLAAYLDDVNERLMNAVNATGETYLSHTKIHNKYALRCAIGNIRTQSSHIANLCRILEECSHTLMSSPL